jgi:hypothetical protein
VAGVIPSCRERGYINAYNDVVSLGIPLRTNFAVISEYINRSLRSYHRRSSYADLDYKFFRDSGYGHACLQKIHDTLNADILSEVLIVECPGDNAGISRLLVIDRLDFVDRSIVAICGDRSYVLFTDDGDFRDSSIEVLTNNPVYFAS